MNVYAQLVQNRLIAILRGFSTEEIVAVADALYQGGVCCVEVTFDQNEAPLKTARMIELLVQANEGKLLIGAGTVLTTEQLEAAAGAGARYIISPNADETIIRKTKERGLVSMPGAYTPTEIIAARQWGADIVKVFPLGQNGVEYLKAIHAPLCHIPLAAVGGVNQSNAASLLQSGACCLGVGSNLVSPADVRSGNLERITRNAEEFVHCIEA